MYTRYLSTLAAFTVVSLTTPALAAPVMTTSSDGVTATIDVVGANPHRNVWFLQLPDGVDHSILDDVWDTAAAGATLVYTGRTNAAGAYHLTFDPSFLPPDAVYAAYTPFSGIYFLGTMVLNPSQSMVLQPGPGFAGPTPEPGRIGAGDARAIARWDVVPYQTITEATAPTFKVGVVAFHIADIDRVEMSVEGGPWTAVREMTLNDRTGVWEYNATIDASLFTSDGPIELRAIAYPKDAAPQAEGTGGYPGGGDPRLLDSLFLYVDVDTPQTPNVAYCSPLGDDGNPGTEAAPVRSPFRAAMVVAQNGGGSADGGIVYMDAGDYDWSTDRAWWESVPATADRWLTFMARPGVPRDQVRIVGGGYPGVEIDRVHLRDVTLHHHVAGDDGGQGGSDSIWLDQVTCQGAGIGTSVHFGGWTPAFMARYWTDIVVRDDASSIPGSVSLARNVDAQRVQYGPSRPRLVVNCTWDTVNNGGTSNHPDFIHWNFAGQGTTFDNQICYGITGTNIGALGVFFKDTGRLENIALVNVAIEMLGSGGSPMGENCQGIDHFLMWNVTHDGHMYWDLDQSAMRNMSFRGSMFGAMSIGPFGDSLDDGWFDQNHFEIGSGRGTNATSGDAQLVDTFTPGPASPLRNRLDPLLVPSDKDGAIRTAPATIGAVE